MKSMFFQNGRLRKSRLMIFIFSILAFLSIMWPGYAHFADYEPFILGIPLSFAWIILWVILSFVAMMSMYILDNRDEEEPE